MSDLMSLLEGILAQSSRENARVLPCDERRIQAERVAAGNFQRAFTSSEFHHAHHEWFYLWEGESHIEIGDAVYRVAAGDSCFLPPRTHHCDVFQPSTQRYESLWFIYRERQVSLNHFRYQPVGKWDVIGYGSIEAPDALPMLLIEMGREVTQSFPFGQTMQRALMQQITAMLARQVAQRPLSARYAASGELSRRVLDYLETHYARELSLHEIAQAVYLSPNYLAALFKKERGTTIVEALTEIRLRHARRLLLENKFSVGEVAAMVGYSTPSYFSRIFHRRIGVAPHRYGK